MITPHARGQSTARRPMAVTASSKLAVQDLEKLNVNELNALSPEVISRQATINIGASLAHSHEPLARSYSRCRHWQTSETADKGGRPASDSTALPKSHVARHCDTLAAGFRCLRHTSWQLGLISCVSELHAQRAAQTARGRGVLVRGAGARSVLVLGPVRVGGPLLATYAIPLEATSSKRKK